MKNILVTGGAGFIGINLIAVLLEQGYQVRILDNMSRSVAKRFLPKNIEILSGDIRYPRDAGQATSGIDCVVHLAAYGSVIESIEDPLENFDINVRGTLNMLMASQKAGVKKFIMASTGGALIGNAIPPVNEKSLPKPISPYGAGKLCCEAYCNAFAESFGLNTIILRFANVFGPFSAHKKGAVTAFIKAIMNNTPIKIYGDGSATRDFLYVDDLCRGILSVIQQDIVSATVLHLASGREVSVKELAEAIMDAASIENYAIEYLPHRRGEVERNFANYDFATQLINFKPETAFQHGIEFTWQWFQKYKNDVL